LKEIKCKILTSEEELPKSLRQCRENLQSRSLTTFEQFTDSLFLAWDQLSSIESNTTLSFQLPPLHRFDGLNAIVSEIVHPTIWKMNRYFHSHYDHEHVVVDDQCYGMVERGESTLIIGPAGIGKTTIQISLVVLLLLLVDSTVPVYVNYDQPHDQVCLPCEAIHCMATELGIIEHMNDSVVPATSCLLEVLHKKASNDCFVL
jgi:hypothetical protein